MAQNDPEAFMNDLALHGLPWKFIELTPEQAEDFCVAEQAFQKRFKYDQIYLEFFLCWQLNLEGGICKVALRD